jgi:hypothetical protein
MAPPGVFVLRGGAVSTAVISGPDERGAMSRAEDDASRDIAKELEQQHPRWIVIFGAFTREFLCLPRFAVPPGLKVVTVYPEAAAARMSKVERLCRVREGLREASERTDGGPDGHSVINDDGEKRGDA